jgi:hypothetical protein
MPDQQPQLRLKSGIAYLLRRKAFLGLARSAVCRCNRRLKYGILVELLAKFDRGSTSSIWEGCISQETQCAIGHFTLFVCQQQLTLKSIFPFSLSRNERPVKSSSRPLVRPRWCLPSLVLDSIERSIADATLSGFTRGSLRKTGAAEIRPSRYLRHGRPSRTALD